MIILFLFNFMRTVLIVIGVLFVLRLIGRMMVAKRNLDEHQQLEQERRRSEQDRMNAQRNYGKTTISKVDKNKFNDGDYVEFEEVEE